MPRAFRLPVLHACCLTLSVLILSATSGADPATAHPLHGARAHSARASTRHVKGRKSASSRRSGCAAPARGSKHRKSGKSCVVRKRPRATRRSVPSKRLSPPVASSPAVGSPSLQTPAITGASATRLSEAPGSAGGSSPQAPGGVGPAPPEATTPPETTTTSEPAPPLEPPSPVRFFSPTSLWNSALAARAPLDLTSAAVVGALDKEIAKAAEAKKGEATINTTAWSVPIYTVPAAEPTVKVTVENASPQPALQSAWSAVPLPPGAQPAAGTDEHLVVWQPSTDQLWEFWRLVHGASGWKASWGGAMQKVSSDSGIYGPEAWPGATDFWGASASSLSIAGGLITLEDLQLGQINHALAIAVPNTRYRVYAAPARRTDGWSGELQSLPEGAHLRLDPNLNLATLHLPRLTLMMAEAAQRYGIIVRDTAANVAFYAQDPTPTGTNPYVSGPRYFEGKSPQQLLTSFPWSHLQLLKMELHNAA